MKRIKFFPSSKREMIASLLVSFVAVVVVAIARQMWGAYIAQQRGPAAPFDSTFQLLCTLVPIAIGFVIMTLIASIVLSRSLLPVALILIGTYGAYQLPLPPRPDTPEKLHFLAHRADYEAVVEIARADDLEACDRPTSRRRDIFQPPEQYEQVSSESCLVVSHNQCNGLAISFFPLENFYHHIVYVEAEDIDCVCGRDPHVEQQIDSNWYVCEYDWN